MEITLKNKIVIHDNFLLEEVRDRLENWIVNKVEFEDGKIIGENKDKVDTSVRNTQVKPMYNSDISKTHVHWHNYLMAAYTKAYGIYEKRLDLKLFPIVYGVRELCILKYPINGKYLYHIDHAATVPRTLSMVYFLNDDYDGGQLCFTNPDGSEESCVPVEKNRLVMWPSNFLYPHTVKPITRGVKYSIVAWAL